MPKRKLRDEKEKISQSTSTTTGASAPSTAVVSSSNPLNPERDSDTSKPTINDVLSGRGYNINNHPGNQYYRKIVEKQKKIYALSHFKRERKMIIASIALKIRELKPPGRFLSNNSKSGLWYEISEDSMHKKISQALRENAKAIQQPARITEREMHEKNKSQQQTMTKKTLKRSQREEGSKGQPIPPPLPLSQHPLYPPPRIANYPTNLATYHAPPTWTYPNYYSYAQQTSHEDSSLDDEQPRPVGTAAYPFPPYQVPPQYQSFPSPLFGPPSAMPPQSSMSTSNPAIQGSAEYQPYRRFSAPAQMPNAASSNSGANVASITAPNEGLPHVDSLDVKMPAKIYATEHTEYHGQKSYFNEQSSKHFQRNTIDPKMNPVSLKSDDGKQIRRNNIDSYKKSHVVLSSRSRNDVDTSEMSRFTTSKSRIGSRRKHGNPSRDSRHNNSGGSDEKYKNVQTSSTDFNPGVGGIPTIDSPDFLKVVDQLIFESPTDDLYPSLFQSPRASLSPMFYNAATEQQQQDYRQKAIDILQEGELCYSPIRLSSFASPNNKTSTRHHSSSPQHYYSLTTNEALATSKDNGDEQTLQSLSYRDASRNKNYDNIFSDNIQEASTSVGMASTNNNIPTLNLPPSAMTSLKPRGEASKTTLYNYSISEPCESMHSNDNDNDNDKEDHEIILTDSEVEESFKSKHS